MQIFVQIHVTKTIALEVDNSNTIEDVKTMIQDKEGIPREYQSLVLPGKKIYDPNTLASRDVKENSTFHMFTEDPVPREIWPIFIELFHDYNNIGPFQILATAESTIGDLKTKIEVLTGIPVSEQRLLSDDTCSMLHDDRRLSDWNIKKGSKMTLFMGTMGS